MAFILVVHILACILLVITILMQAGRGGGLAESFSSAESMFGTQANKFMVRTSTVLGVIFFSTSLFLAVVSAKGHKSLMENSKLPIHVTQPAKAEEPSVKVSEPKPMSADQAETKAKEVAQPLTNTAQ